MRRIILLAIYVLVLMDANAQTNEQLVELAKTYRQFMFRNKPPESVYKMLSAYSETEMSFVASFITETIRPGSDILSEKYLKRPSDEDLKRIHVIRQLNLNLSKEKPKDHDELIQNLNSKDVSVYEMLDSYYTMLFSAYGNKVQPYDLSKTDFQLNDYGFKDEVEKGIFFLISMRLNGLLIFGYMNVVKPPNYSKALEFINLYPKYNGSPYYQYSDFSFPDFKMEIESGSGKQSYKAYYIDKYYETLLSHLDCLRQQGDKEKIYDLVLGSILKDEQLYRYSKRKAELNNLLKKYEAR